MLRHYVGGFEQSKDRHQNGEILNLYFCKQNLFNEKLLNLSKR